MKNFDKLEVGAAYRNGAGETVGIYMKDNDPDRAGPFHGEFLDGDEVGATVYYRADGRVNYNRASHGADSADLVEKLA